MPASPHSFNEHRWVVQIRQQIEEDQLDENADAGLPISIFNVPKPLMAAKPEAYSPQQVAIGPYHHLRPELHEMERYKLSSARWVQRSLGQIKFEAVVDQFTRLEHRIRSSYHRYLELNGDTLAWMMAIDASFLLDYLNLCAIDHRQPSPASGTMSHLICTGRKAAHGAISRDIIMLENQIPLFLLSKLLEFQCASPQESEKKLVTMLICFCKELSPFKMADGPSEVQLSDQGGHLLQVLYHAVVPPEETTPGSGQRSGENADEEIHNHGDDNPNSYQQKSSCRYFLEFIDAVWNRTARRLLPPHPVKLIVKIPWKILRNLPVCAILRQPIDGLLDTIFDPEASGNVGKHKDGGEDRLMPLLAEELEIPSASELKDAGLRFQATTGDLRSIRFDSKNAAFFLPIITVDANTEVIMRNLVVYEASAMPGSLVFTRYTELMNGIIDGEEDVRVLREAGIICNHLKSDDEAACMWNSMSRSVRLTKVKHLDEVIQEVNRYYHGSWRVKARKFMGRYVFASWQLLTLLAAVLLLLMMAFQAFCLVYGCSHFSGRVKSHGTLTEENF